MKAGVGWLKTFSQWLQFLHSNKNKAQPLAVAVLLWRDTWPAHRRNRCPGSAGRRSLAAQRCIRGSFGCKNGNSSERSKSNGEWIVRKGNLATQTLERQPGLMWCLAHHQGPPEGHMVLQRRLFGQDRHTWARGFPGVGDGVCTKMLS